MDKGQLPADKLMNVSTTETNADDVASAKKEKQLEKQELTEATPSQTSGVIHNNKTLTRGKETNDKKQDVAKTKQEVNKKHFCAFA